MLVLHACASCLRSRLRFAPFRYVRWFPREGVLDQILDGDVPSKFQKQTRSLYQFFKIYTRLYTNFPKIPISKIAKIDTVSYTKIVKIDTFPDGKSPYPKYVKNPRPRGVIQFFLHYHYMSIYMDQKLIKCKKLILQNLSRISEHLKSVALSFSLVLPVFTTKYSSKISSIYVISIFTFYVTVIVKCCVSHAM